MGRYQYPFLGEGIKTAMWRLFELVEIHDVLKG
jgi:hypothetical protein